MNESTPNPVVAQNQPDINVNESSNGQANANQLADQAAGMQSPETVTAPVVAKESQPEPTPATESSKEVATDASGNIEGDNNNPALINNSEDVTSQYKVEDRPNGTALIKGDTKQLKVWAKENGITAASHKDGIIIGKKSVEKATSIIRGSTNAKQEFYGERSDWGDFPDVVLHGKLADATSNKDYSAAKAGDHAAALRVVTDTMSKPAIEKLKAIIGNRKSIALAVHANEDSGVNALPGAMADVLGKVS